MKCMIVLFALAAVAAGNPNWGHGGGQWNNWAGHDNTPRWHGPIAVPPGFDKHGAPLPVQDTPEVAALKAAQVSTLASAGGAVPAHNAWAGAPGAWNAGAHGAWNGANGAWNGANGAWNGANGAWNGAHGAWNGAQGAWAGAPAAGAWAGAPAAGAWAGAHGGLPVDTPEVAAAKAAHLAAVASVSHGAHGHRWRRSAVLPLLAQTATVTPGSTALLGHGVVAAAPLSAVVAPARSWGYSATAVAPLHGAWGNGAWGNGAWGNNGAWGHGAWAGHW